MKKRKNVYEEIILPIFLSVASWRFLKTGSIKQGLITLFGLLFLYIVISIIKSMMYKRKMFKSGIDKIDQMSGQQFEYYLSQMLGKQGYKVRLTKVTGDFGADLVLTSPTGKIIVVQAKRYKKNVGIKAVQEVGTSMSHYNATEAWVITNSYYTKAARTLAKSNGIQLYNRDNLINWIIKAKQPKVS
ncbi:restriction endonuclease [Lederbergia citrea]|uniref:restriction endonuclease n=1 Tax=Lederbergia citrea TaxID=2833581 RepID=UPI002015EB2C|nr:restriction endonuclease [Lederbergia citrea]